MPRIISELEGLMMKSRTSRLAEIFSPENGWYPVGMFFHPAGLNTSGAITIIAGDVLLVAPKAFHQHIRETNKLATVVTKEWLIRHPQEITNRVVVLMWWPEPNLSQVYRRE